MKEPETIEAYNELFKSLHSIEDQKELYSVIRYLCRTDLYFFIYYALGRKDVAHPWLLARCKEVQNNPDGFLDLWAREHYKSTIITFALTMQDIISSHGDDPLPKWYGLEPVIGFFSHTRPIAKGFLRQPKREFESNELLRKLFPDVIWENPHRDAPKWSEDDGLILKRRSNPKESTLEAWGLVEGQPTGKHFDIMVYDDVVTLSSVTTPEMMRKTLEAWEMSINLGAKSPRRRYIGTRYHFNDAYREIMKRAAAKPRIYAGTHDGTETGDPVLKTREQIIELRRTMGAFTFSTQILNNPLADEKQGFKREWVRFYQGSDGSNLNRYFLVDPASEKKKSSDYTAMWIIGLGSDENYYVLDIVRDRLNLKERGDMVFYLHRKWRPLGVGYEHFGMQADIEYIKERQARENYHFNITPLGGQVPKNDRIKRLIPSYEQGRWYFPHSLMRANYQGKIEDLVETYINEEFMVFPVPVHDDMMDCQARILEPDLNVIWPLIEHEDKYDRYNKPRSRQRGSGWAT